MKDIAIRVEHVSKTFRLPHEKNTSVKGAVVNFWRHKKGYENQKALEDVSFEVKKGEFFGIVGRNGSGKSTLLKMLAGIYTPSKGNIEVNGKLTPFIELGVGFNPELTGRENVFLNGALLGFNRKQMNDMYEDIVKFAELDRFMDQKLKNYSSGMQVRLAFSIAIRAKSDILLIDEVLAVGDAAFQAKCFDYFQEVKLKDTTVVFVSHDRAALERFCARGVLINDGRMIHAGPIKEVLQKYSRVVMDELDSSKIDNKEASVEKDVIKKPEFAEIYEVFTLDSKDKKQKRFTYGEEVVIKYSVKIKRPITNPILGVTIFQKNIDKAIFATNTLIEDQPTGNLEKGDILRFEVELPNGLNDGEYYIEPAIANESATMFYDQLPRAATFFINGSRNPYSLFSDMGKINLVKER